MYLLPLSTLIDNLFQSASTLSLVTQTRLLWPGTEAR